MLVENMTNDTFIMKLESIFVNLGNMDQHLINDFQIVIKQACLQDIFKIFRIYECHYQTVSQHDHKDI